jgi:penicillin-binding protein 2
MIRFKFLIIFIIIITITLIIRIYFISIKSNEYYENLSKNNYIQRVYKYPSRGIITDRNGVALAINKLGFSINIRPHLTDISTLKDTIDKILKHLPEFKNKDLIKLYQSLNSPYKHSYIKLIPFIEYSKFFDKYVLFNLLDNIKIDLEVKRFYPYGKVASHIIGYVGKISKNEIKNNKLSSTRETIGKNGLEKFYNSILQGKKGYQDIKVNALNKKIDIIDNQEPSLNNNLKTTIDIRLQKYISDIFDKKSGSVIVMNVNTGAILSASSFPQYDNNIFVDGISVIKWKNMRNDFNHPFTNKLVNGLYPPGSIIKMGTALSFLENGIKSNYTVFDTGELKIGKRNFRGWKLEGHGKTGFIKAIRESVDDFFYKGSLKVGINKMSQTLHKLGFGKKTGVDQVNEFRGTNPNKLWKRVKYNMPWYIGETAISSIGQGFILVTPMQIARYTSFLATSKLPIPHLSQDNYKKPIKIKINKKYLNLIRRGMYQVSNYPSGTLYKYIQDNNNTIASKTGTAQVISIPQEEKKRMKESELEYYHRSHAWITSYAPYKNPKYSVTILVEHGGHGGKAAGRIMDKIYTKLKELKYIK